MAQSFLRQPVIERLPNLVDELRSGGLRMPPFQRSFVWSGEQRLQLFDSVRKGLPTGSLMVWRTAKHLPEDPEVGPLRIDYPKLRPEQVTQYLLDGRQRLTTLFAALAPGLWSREGAAPPVWDELAPDNTAWGVVFDLERQAFHLDSGEVQGDGPLLPLALILDDFGLDAWLRDCSASREHWNRARNLKSAIVDYLVPVVPLVSDDIEVVTLTFKRVNNAGTPMGNLDMARALSWSEKFDLSDHIEEVQDALGRTGWAGLDKDTILKVLAGAAGLEPTSFDLETLAVTLREQPRLMNEVADVLDNTTRLLCDVGFAGPSAMPYEWCLVWVARAFQQGASSSEQLTILKAWVAAVCITEAFSNAPPHVMRAMWRELEARLKLPGFSTVKRRKNGTAKQCVKFSMAWARSKVTAAVLAHQQPRRSNGKALVKPHKVVATLGTQALPMLVVRRGRGLSEQVRASLEEGEYFKILLRAPANRVLCEPEDLVDLRRALFSPDASDALLNSHMLDRQCVDRLLNGGSITPLLQQRQHRIIAAEKAWYTELGAGSLVNWPKGRDLLNRPR